MPLLPAAEVVASVTRTASGYFLHVSIGPFVKIDEATAELNDVVAVAKSLGMAATSTPPRTN